MKKFTLISVFIVSTFLFSISIVKAYDNNLTNMIDVRSDEGWNSEVNQMVTNLNKVDSRILRHTNAQGVRIILMDGPLTELPEFQHLSGLVPRGWSETGLTWDEVPGAGGHTVAARIGYSNTGNGHSVVNLELHEYAHAVDEYSAGFKISYSNEFQNIHEQEKANLFYDHSIPEYFDMVDEYFAEAFAMYYLNESTRGQLQSRAPMTYHFIANLHSRLITVEERTGNTVRFSFTPYSNASSYNIYRDGELIDNVVTGEYTDTGLSTSTQYQYYYKAVNSSGEEIFTSYYNTTSTTDTPDVSVDKSELVSLIARGEEIAPERRTVTLQNMLTESYNVRDDSGTSQQTLDETVRFLTTALNNNVAQIEAEDRAESEVDNTDSEEAIIGSDDVTTPDEDTEDVTSTESGVETEEPDDVTLEDEVDSEVEPVEEVEEVEETDTVVQANSSQERESRYPAWVYFLSSAIGILATGGTLYAVSKKIY